LDPLGELISAPPDPIAVLWGGMGPPGGVGEGGKERKGREELQERGWEGKGGDWRGEEGRKKEGREGKRREEKGGMGRDTPLLKTDRRH